MGINITHTMNSSHFESRENLRNTAKSILNRQNATTESSNKVLDVVLFNNASSNTQLNILNTSAQITLNNSLKETLKYLKTQATKKNTKKYVLGELWNILEENNEKDSSAELIDFVIDYNTKNIFAA